MAKKYVLTGGPGVGKSTTLKVLSNKKGVCTLREAATYVITQELDKEKQGKEAQLPWTDRDGFQKRVLEQQLRWEEGIPFHARIFLDRGVIDGLAYYRLDGITPPKELEKAAEESRYDKIFLLERLTSFERTTTRREDLETAQKLHYLVEKEYKKYGYNPIRIPEADPESRAHNILGLY
ncbi:AAA family ATPase [Nanoarchaeota archaeon]